MVSVCSDDCDVCPFDQSHSLYGAIDTCILLFALYF